MKQLEVIVIVNITSTNEWLNLYQMHVIDSPDYNTIGISGRESIYPDLIYPL